MGFGLVTIKGFFEADVDGQLADLQPKAATCFE
jgi:hypothetical protein